MWLVPIEVSSHADSASESGEMPRRLRPKQQWLEVLAILDRWYEAGTHPEWPAADYFKVLTSDEHIHLIKHDLECGDWFWIRRW